MPLSGRYTCNMQTTEGGNCGLFFKGINNNESHEDDFLQGLNKAVSSFGTGCHMSDD